MSTTTAADAVKYELMVMIAPDIGEAAIKNRVDALKKTLTDFGGEITFEDDWGVRELAYSIGKHDQGYYFVLDVNLDSKHVKELERILRLEVEVLRHLIMKLPNAYQPKTLATMEAEHAVEAAKNAEIKAEADQKKMGRPMMGGAGGMAPRKPYEAPKATTPKVEVADAAASTNKDEAKKAAPKKKEESKKELEDIDAKLDSILSNPDINF